MSDHEPCTDTTPMQPHSPTPSTPPQKSLDLGTLKAGKVELGFPIYAVEYAANTGTIFVAGGGGPAKSGYAFKYTARENKVRHLSDLSCGQEAPTSMTIHPRWPEYLACGVNDRCWVIERSESEKYWRSLNSFFLDFLWQEIRTWEFPWLKPVSDFTIPKNSIASAKENRVEDVDYDQSGEFIVVLTPAAIHVQSRKDGSFCASIAANPDFRFRCARFLKESDPKSCGYLVTVENHRERGCPLLTLWKVDSWTRVSSVSLATRLRVTALSVSENGKFIAIGAADGTVGVYDSKLNMYYFQRELHKFIIPSVSINDFENVRILITGSGDGSFCVIPIRKSRPWTWIGLILVTFITTILILFALFSCGIIGDEEL